MKKSVHFLLSRDVSFQDFFRKSLDFWMSTRCWRFWERFCLKFYVFPAKQKHPRDPCIIQYHSMSFNPKNVQNDSHQVTSHLSCRCSRHSRKRTRNPCNNCSFVPQSPQKNVERILGQRSDWNDKITIWKKCLCRCVGLMSEMKTCSVPHFGDGCNKMCKPHTEKKKVTPGISEAYPVLFRWKVVTHGFRAWQCQQKQPCTFNPWAVNKTLVTFQYTSWFLGILGS